MPPTDSELLSIYDLSKQEAKIYRMKLSGSKLSEISDYLNISLQCVKNAMVSINSKIKEREHPMDFITINQQNEGLRRKALAMMSLRIIATDQDLTELYDCTHTIVLKNMKPIIGDTDFIVREVFTHINPLPDNDLDARRKAEAIYKKYLECGGKKGEMGYGFAKWLFDKYYVKYDLV